jgi:hypothetical protein
MHAGRLLQKCFADVFSGMHALRVQVVVGAVLALLSCRRLVLMDLARAWPGAQRVRAPLKRLDRLLSNTHLHGEQVALYAHMARWLVRGTRPVIVVDWSTLKEDESWHLLRAAVAVGGRTLTVYEEVHCQRKQQSPRVHRRFLKRLKQLLPPGSCPIILTDAGFRCPWFRQVETLGWHWIGRVRNRVYVKGAAGTDWQLTKSLFSGNSLRVFGAVHLVRQQPFACQLLRYRQALQGRKHRTARGTISRNKASREAARSRREPWLLAYSNSLQELAPRQVVNCYRKRMQIELSFRDLKSERYGCAFRHSLTRKAPRIAVLLVLHALASFLAWLQGLTASLSGHSLHCVIRARTRRAHYSIVRIGWEALRRDHPPPPLLHSLRLASPPPWLRHALGNPA